MSIFTDAMFKIPYGLFLLSSRSGSKDCACIINTVQQVTDDPLRFSVTLNKRNYTHDIIVESGILNVSVLTEQTPFSTIKRFGFSSGRDTDKFQGITMKRSENDIVYDDTSSNSLISGRVISMTDCGTHTIFLADVTETIILSDATSLTYDHYRKYIKPSSSPKRKGFICRVCGYFYEGAELPEGYICPLCGHGMADFVRTE